MIRKTFKWCYIALILLVISFIALCLWFVIKTTIHEKEQKELLTEFTRDIKNENYANMKSYVIDRDFKAQTESEIKEYVDSTDLKYFKTGNYASEIGGNEKSEHIIYNHSIDDCKYDENAQIEVDIGSDSKEIKLAFWKQDGKWEVVFPLYYEPLDDEYEQKGDYWKKYIYNDSY